MKKKYLLVLGIFLMGGELLAQQNPHYSQYMYNQSVVNPAYAGSTEALSLGVLHRQQWVGLEGAPVTTTFFGHKRVGKNVGLGLSAISDKIGPVKENNIYGDFSYTLELGRNHNLALGLKAGVTMHDIGLYSEIGNGFIPDSNDPAFAEDSKSTLFNVGLGAYYYTENYYVGLGVPNLLKGNYLDYDGKQFGTQEMHMFLTGGYVFEVNDMVKLKPSTMVKYTMNAPVTFDISLNAMFMDKLEVGATYRLEDAVGGMINYRILPNLRVGYAYDHVMSDLKVKGKASHEFILLYDIFFSRKVSSSPRYF